MQIKECMSQEVQTVEPGDSIQKAARLMRDGDFGIVPVAENDRLIGMVTDRDIAIRATAEGLNPNETKVRDVMSNRVLYCFEDQDVSEVADMMASEHVRRMPVMNRNKRLVGIVSLGDMTESEVNFEDTMYALKQTSARASA